MRRITDDDPGKNGGEGCSKQIWTMLNGTPQINSERLLIHEKKAVDVEELISLKDVVKNPEQKNKMDDQVMDSKVAGATVSPEVFCTDDAIVNTQESAQGEVDGTDPRGVVQDGEDTKVDYLDGKTNKDGGIESDTMIKDNGGDGEGGLISEEKMTMMPDKLKAVVVRDGGTEAVGPEVQDRRRSDRLKKTTSLSTMEKNAKMAMKINLEGNSSCSNSFAALPIEDIVSMSHSMGVNIENDSFETFNLLKNLEQARGDLYKKQDVIKKIILKLNQLSK